MRQIIFLCLALSMGSGLTAQEQEYFQQETHYRIEVTLNDSLHTLRGTLDLTYVNHSPDELPFIWFHLWPNAYRDQTTAFARQQLRTNGTNFYFAKDSQLGYIDSLQFVADEQALQVEYHPQHPDIAKVWLPDPLKPGGAIRIITPFFVKIPDSFSRLGHVDQSYQITQWYPKPAVYDRNGWHPMPYLDMGEFYSEFGSFDVRISLPANYVVGATGMLQTETEKAFLAEKVVQTQTYLDGLPPEANDWEYDPFSASSDVFKTIRYTAENVHDFAWFADKRFKVQQDSVNLPNGHSVTTWSMFTKAEEQLWRKSIGYINRSIQFYSELIGDYPYPQATAVQSALSAGGGMEYPMITVIDLAGSPASLDEVITHEIGHNWMYGILASNERDHPWMDEGLNSFYEQRYMRKFYANTDRELAPALPGDSNSIDISTITYLTLAQQRKDQAPDTPSDDFSAINYWLGAYDKPAKALWHLYHYLGQEDFDRAMQTYFQEWQFKHPQPNDLQESLERSSGKKLDWLFAGLLYSNQHLDYAIGDVKTKGDRFMLQLENRGDILAPIPLYGFQGEEVVFQTWMEPFSGQEEIEIPSGTYDHFAIDPFHHTLDVYRKNNRIKAQGAFKKVAPFRFKPVARLEDERFTNLSWFPILGWNLYDGFQAGLLIHNHSLPYKPFEFDLLPLYGFTSKSFNGLGNVNYRIFPKQGIFQQFNLRLNYRGFHFQREEEGIYDLRYQRWQPSLDLEFRQLPKTTFSHKLQYRLILLGTERPLIGREEGFMGLAKDHATIHELSYQGRNYGFLHPFHYRMVLEQQDYTDVFGQAQNYLKWSLDWSSEFTYRPEKVISARLFIGGFLTNTRRDGGAIFPGAFSLIDQAASDYRYDDFYFGRSEREGFWSQQSALRDGGFKVPLNPAFSLGKSNNFILAINLKADLPFGAHLPIKPYFDLGYFDNAMPTGNDDTFSDQLLWSGGLALEILKGRFGLYFPLVNSKNLQDRLLEQGGYGKRIAFRFDLYGEKVREMLLDDLRP